MGQRTTKHAKYFESILQLRNPYGDVEDMMHYVVQRTNGKAQDGIFISKKKKVTNGFDLYLSSNSFAVEIGRELYRAFGGELKISKKLFSQHKMTSRILYRVTVLFRMAPFRVGDVVLFDGKPLKMIEISKKVVAENIEKGKLVELHYKDILRSFEVLKPVRAIVSKTQPHLEVIHPETFQSVPVLPLVKNSKLVPGEKVRILISEGKVWLAA
ncbi:hypothetical protein HYU40_01440 [Candidatus Woesearchaeota archaeon]|nr:hypothetical protein [Candidatus Woesearchaeota archaeon]